MAKLMKMFLILIAIQFAIILFYDQTAEQTVIWDFVTNWSSWTTGSFVLAIVGIAGGIGLIGVAASYVFGFKTDFLIFAPAIAGFIATGIIFTNLSKIVYSAIAAIFGATYCPIALSCGPALWITTITVGPVALLYVWSVVEWWRGKDY